MGPEYCATSGGGVAPDDVPGSSYYDASDSGSLDRFNVDCRQISQNENVSEWLRPGCWHVLTFMPSERTEMDGSQLPKTNSQRRWQNSPDIAMPEPSRFLLAPRLRSAFRKVAKFCRSQSEMGSCGINLMSINQYLSIDKGSMSHVIRPASSESRPRDQNHY